MHRGQDRSNRPIDELKKSLDKYVLIRLKTRGYLYRARLLGYDDHLNISLDECQAIYNIEDEDGKLVEEREDLGRIIVRGDNVIFIEIGQAS